MQTWAGAIAQKREGCRHSWRQEEDTPLRPKHRVFCEPLIAPSITVFVVASPLPTPLPVVFLLLLLCACFYRVMYPPPMGFPLGARPLPPSGPSRNQPPHSGATENSLTRQLSPPRKPTPNRARIQKVRFKCGPVRRHVNGL